jgi:hypothetical protein
MKARAPHLAEASGLVGRGAPDVKAGLLIAAILLVLGAAAIAFSWPEIERWLEIDICLDRGGVWDEEAKQCRY